MIKLFVVLLMSEIGAITIGSQIKNTTTAANTTESAVSSNTTAPANATVTIPTISAAD